MRDVPTCLVAEDESLLRRSLVEHLGRAWPQLRIVAECEDGASAVEALAELEPDVAFLDIRMPGLTGLEVAAAATEASPRTRIVFVTAYDQYAIDAFEQGAVDYLLKPIKPERLAATVERLQRSAGDVDAVALSALLDRIGTLPRGDAPPPLTWLTASAGSMRAASAGSRTCLEMEAGQEATSSCPRVSRRATRRAGIVTHRAQRRQRRAPVRPVSS